MPVTATAMRSEDGSFRPSNHPPTQTTPASENAALLFERS